MKPELFACCCFFFIYIFTWQFRSACPLCVSAGPSSHAALSARSSQQEAHELIQQGLWLHPFGPLTWTWDRSLLWGGYHGNGAGQRLWEKQRWTVSCHNVNGEGNLNYILSHVDVLPDFHLTLNDKNTLKREKNLVVNFCLCCEENHNSVSFLSMIYSAL